MKRVTIGIGAILCLAIGWIASTAEREASAAVEQLAEFQDVGEVNDVRVYRISDRGHDCYVTVPAGGISCGR